MRLTRGQMMLTLIELDAQDIVFTAIAARLDYDDYLAYTREIGEDCFIAKKDKYSALETRYFKAVDIVNYYITNQQISG